MQSVILCSKIKIILTHGISWLVKITFKQNMIKKPDTTDIAVNMVRLINYSETDVMIILKCDIKFQICEKKNKKYT